MKKKIRGAMLFLACCSIIFGRLCLAAQEDLSFGGSLYAKAAVLMDAKSGRVLFEKDGYERLPMASTTKVMTCILALEQGNVEELATASSYAASMPKVRLGVKANEQFRILDLLYSLMLESHNDAAVVIAEHLGGSVEGFAAMMNAKAREIGCEDTYFITPNGLDAQDGTGVHATTARDLARMLSYCIEESPKREQFLEITGTASWQFADADGKRQFSCTNHNTFLNMMEGAISGKTGFTGDAGYCYVGALRRDGRTFVVALLACGWPNNKGYKWSDTRKLMEYAIANYEYRDVWEDMEFEGIPVEDGVPAQNRIGAPARVPVGMAEGAGGELLLLLRKDEQVRVETELTERLAAPVGQGQQVGSVRYYLGDALVGEYPICTVAGVGQVDYFWCLGRVLWMFAL